MKEKEKIMTNPYYEALMLMDEKPPGIVRVSTIKTDKVTGVEVKMGDTVILRKLHQYGYPFNNRNVLSEELAFEMACVSAFVALTAEGTGELYSKVASGDASVKFIVEPLPEE